MAKAKKKVVEKGRIDIDSFRNYINEGKNAKEIMEAFNIKNMGSIKNALLNLIMTDSKVYKLAGLTERKSQDFKISTLGIRIPWKRIEGKGFNESDTFRLDFDEDKIILNKVVEE